MCCRYNEKLGLVPATYLSETPVNTEPEAATVEDTTPKVIISDYKLCAI